jgi:alkylation response protein AidB-like acyl-CoA dehydrogenase
MFINHTETEGTTQWHQHLWAGTMDLTEPQAGSDVGDSSTKAMPTDKPGQPGGFPGGLQKC